MLAAARQIAEGGGADLVDATHLAGALLSEPDGLAARVIHAAGLPDEQVLAALEVGPATGPGDAAPAALQRLRFTDAGRAALRDTLKAALSLGHNYIGTEHLLLGILGADGDPARALSGLGLTVEVAQQKLADEFAAIQARRHAGWAGLRGPAPGPGEKRGERPLRPGTAVPPVMASSWSKLVANIVFSSPPRPRPPGTPRGRGRQCVRACVGARPAPRRRSAGRCARRRSPV